MKKILFTLIALIFPFTLNAQALSQNQAIIPPYGGMIVATSTSGNSKLSATTSPTINWITATSTSRASTFPLASTTALTVSGSLFNTSLSDGCIQVSSGLMTSTGSACGSGGGGSWATSSEAFYWSQNRDWNVLGTPKYLAPTTTIGMIVNASSTISELTVINGTTTSATSTNLYTSGQTILAGVSGNVGIGTVAPDGTLTIGNNAGTIYFGNGASGSYGSFTGSGNSGFFEIAETANSGVRIQGAAGVTVKKTTGFTGIGTTTPGNALSVQSSSDDVLKISNYTSNSNPALVLQNDAETWNIQNAGARSDNFEIYDVGSGAVRLAINQSGNVGIGTTTPASKLDTAGVIRSVSSTIVAPITGAGLEMFYNPSLGGSGVYSIDRDTATYKILDIRASQTTITQGNVGIGTTTPSSKLSVEGSSASALTVMSRLSSGPLAGDIQFDTRHNASRNGWELQSVSRGGSALTLSLNPDGGNVGIGTTSPWGNLSVSASSPNVVIASTLAGNDAVLTFDNTAQSGSEALIKFLNQGVLKGQIRYDINDAVADTMNFYTAGTSRVAINANGMAINNGITAPTSGNGLIVASGNVGVGTTSPVSLLEVAKTQDAGTNIYVTNASTGGSAGSGLILSNESTGLGGSFGQLITLGSGYSASDIRAANRTWLNSSGGDLAIGTRTSGKSILFHTGGITAASERMRIDGNGNVGIGTTTPAYKLDVFGDGFFEGSVTLNGGDFSVRTGGSIALFNSDNSGTEATIFNGSAVSGESTLVLSSNGAQNLIIDNSGKVGIGTTSPYAELAIGGDTVIGASTAGGTLGDLYLPKLGVAAGTFLAVDATGKVIATTTPAGGSQTPWTSNINAAGFELLDAGGIKATSTIATSTVAASSTEAVGAAMTGNTSCPFSIAGYCYPYNIGTTSLANTGTSTLTIPAMSIITFYFHASSSSITRANACIFFNNDRSAIYDYGWVRTDQANNGSDSASNAKCAHTDNSPSFSGEYVLQGYIFNTPGQWKYGTIYGIDNSGGPAIGQSGVSSFRYRSASPITSISVAPPSSDGAASQSNTWATTTYMRVTGF